MEFTIEKAVRKALPISIMISGASGTGKTMSALKLARGLLGNPDDRICLIDSENSRASYYADTFDFDVINIEPPHTPERYLKAFRQAEKIYKVIIIDSISLVWDGEGGCCDMADTQAGHGINTWLKPKLEHRKLLNAIHSSKIDKIICCRTKETIEQVGDKFIKGSDSLVCEKSVPYQMLIKFHLKEDSVNVKSCVLGMIESKLNIKKHITSEHGKIIKEWVNEGEEANIELTNAKKECREQAMLGKIKLDEFLDNDKNKELINKFTGGTFKNEIRAIAAEADARKLEQDGETKVELNLNQEEDQCAK